jgi:hypothetical protein
LALLIIGRRIQDGKDRKEGKRMKKEEKKEMIINIAEKLTALDDIDKSYLVGYMAGKTEERQKWVQREAAKASAS